MKKLPLQIESERLAGFPAGNLFTELAAALGELAGWIVDGAARPTDWASLLIETGNELLPSLSASEMKIWRQAVARELLLVSSTIPKLLNETAIHLDGKILAASPFGDGGPSLREWLDASPRCAAALFPLADDNAGGAPGIGQAWVVRGMTSFTGFPCNQAVQDEAATTLARTIADESSDAFLFVEDRDRGLIGDSWQLAAGLAARALHRGSREIVFLAHKVIASGKIERGEVKRIKLGNKLAIPTARQWLLPSSNRADIPPRLSGRLNLKVVANLEAAWRLVSGRGVIDTGSIPWPEGGTDVFHTFTSKAYPVIIAAILFSHPRKEIVLWDSGAPESQDVCANLQTVLPLLLPKCPKVTVSPVSSRNVADAERALREVMEKHYHGETIVFNITNGNLLMRMAAGNLGPLFPTVRFVYRDVDNENLDFTCVQYDGLQPETTTLKAKPLPEDRKWLDRLFFTPRPIAVKPWTTVLAELLGQKSSRPRGNEAQPDDDASSRPIIEEALLKAIAAHDGAFRKGTPIPYVSHPIGVALILAGHGFPSDVVAAGLLHDTVEDTPVTLEEIRAEFGEVPAEMVAECGEPDKERPWKERKQHAIDSISTLSEGAMAVMAADKLHNIRSIAEDFRNLGEALWSRFNHGREEQAWYYRSVARELMKRDGRHRPLAEQLRKEVEGVFGDISVPSEKKSAAKPEKSAPPSFSPM